MMEKLLLALTSFQSLGQAFLETLSGREPSPSLKSGSPACHLDAGITRFYLDWTDEHAGECGGTDWIVIFILFLMVHTVSWWSRWLVWEPVANSLSRNNPKWNDETCKKLSMNMTAAMFFIFSGICAQKILAGKPWLRDPTQWSEIVGRIEPDFKFYYMLYAARFFSDTVSLLFEDRPRDAYIVGFIHHFTTLTLVVVSAHSGFTRVGGVIMSFFDWSDPPLLIAKTCKYLSVNASDTYQVVANRLFELFAVVFFLTRNVFYNYVCYVCFRDFHPMTMSIGICATFLVVLAVLQTYWLGIIIQAVTKMKESGGNVEDIQEKRSHNE